jgi:hypothetical protein
MIRPPHAIPLLATLWVFLGGLAAMPAAEPSPPAGPGLPIRGILYNEDDSNRFGFDSPGTMKPERLDQLVDDLADSQVTAMLLCCNAKKTGFPSKAWQVQCDGFDPALDDRQPFFGDLSPASRKAQDRWVRNLRALLDAGIDPMQRMIDRCRQRKISPWVSIRMNDVHDANLLSSPLHSRFWREHPEYWRYPDRFKGWNDRCLNYGLKPVRDNMMALIREVCDRFDMDGLELDWNRFPLHFREGEEAEQSKVLSAWLGEVRQVVRAAEKKWKHRILLVARVPARPEVAIGTGLDAVAWAKAGLIDHLVVAPFWATTDFDIPVEQWIDLLRGTGVGVTAGLEIRVEPYPGAPTLPNTPERRRGAAMSVLARGSQGVYLFNYFDVGRQMPELLKELHSVDVLATKDRSYVVTFVDISVPGKPIPAALPKRLATGQSAQFRLFVGPKPLASAHGEVQLLVKPEKGNVQVTLNGHAATSADRFAFRASDFVDGYNTIQVTNAGPSAVSVESVELAVRFPKRNQEPLP